MAVLVDVALVCGVLIYRSATAPTDRERMAAAFRALQEAGNRMTPEEVRHSFGPPDAVFRNNPRALCWSYSGPYEIRMCWGPKRQAAWIATNVTPDRTTG